jgi:hypothetical protein
MLAWRPDDLLSQFWVAQGHFAGRISVSHSSGPLPLAQHMDGVGARFSQPLFRPRALFLALPLWLLRLSSSFGFRGSTTLFHDLPSAVLFFPS